LRQLLERHGMTLKPPAHHEGSAGHPIPISTVGAVIFDEADRVLMIHTHKWSGLWGIPGGKIKFGERAEDALRRELKEETALDVHDIRFVLVQDCIHSTEFYRDDHFVLLNYTCRCAGAPEVRLNEEAQEFRWVPLEDAFKLTLNQPTKVLLAAIIAERGAPRA
jgi:ADP-ribose pyrophosphatase YjhB (NUDIX family)